MTRKWKISKTKRCEVPTCTVEATDRGLCIDHQHPHQKRVDYPDWMEAEDLDQVVRRVVEQKLTLLRITRAELLAWAEHPDNLDNRHAMTELDPAAGLVTLDLIEQYARANELELYPAQVALRSQVLDAVLWANRHWWEREEQP